MAKSRARKVASEGEARRFLAAAKSSKRPAREWAREHGIDARSLNLWRVNLERRDRRGACRPGGRAPTRPQLVELVPARVAESAAAAATSTSPRESRSPEYQVVVAGVRVVFGDDFTAATLRRVLEVLRSC